MESLVNLNHNISIVRSDRESLDIIIPTSVGEEQVVKFETVFFDVRYMWEQGNLKIG